MPIRHIVGFAAWCSWSAEGEERLLRGEMTTSPGRLVVESCTSQCTRTCRRRARRRPGCGARHARRSDATTGKSPCTRTPPGDFRRHPGRVAQPRGAPALAEPATAHAPGPCRVLPSMTRGVAARSARQVCRRLRRAGAPAQPPPSRNGQGPVVTGRSAAIGRTKGTPGATTPIARATQRRGFLAAFAHPRQANAASWWRHALVAGIVQRLVIG
jgi:hypothetical protein